MSVYKKFSKVTKTVSLMIITIFSANNLKAEDFRYGIDIRQGIPTTRFGVFLEYKVMDMLGIETGVSYAMNDFVLISSKERDENVHFFGLNSSIVSTIDNISNEQIIEKVNSNDWKKDLNDKKCLHNGFHKVSYISIPIKLVFRPLAGDFAVWIGIDFDFLLDVKGLTNNFSSQDGAQIKKLIKAMAKSNILFDNSSLEEGSLDKDAKDIEGGNLYNNMGIKVSLGFKYDIVYGIELGLESRFALKSFVNYPKDDNGSLEGNFQLFLGWNFAKLF